MLSRIADSLFWMNRYMERSEGLLRVVRTNYILSLDKSPYGVYTWKPVLNIFGQLSEEQREQLEYNTTRTLYYLCAEKDNINSLRQIITKARENARGIQDNITKEVWEQVNQLYHLINHPNTHKILSGDDPVPVIDKLISGGLQFVGVADTTMPRDMGWSFMNLGKLLERCLLTIEITLSHFGNIDSQSNGKTDILYWRNLLLSLSGYELYLKTYLSNSHTNNIIQLLIFDPNFPRSVRYCFDRMEKYLQDILMQNNPVEKDEIIRVFGKMNSMVLFSDIREINERQLNGFLNEIRRHLQQFYVLLGQTFFSYA